MKHVQLIITFNMPDEELDSPEFKKIKKEFDSGEAAKELAGENDIDATDIKCELKISDA